MKILTSVLAAAFAVTAAAQETVVDYRFDEVKRKVTLRSAKQSATVARGQKARSGDLVQTGWFSYALIAAEAYQAKFEIFSATDVTLAGTEPGVILSVERGRLHAIFDKITGNEPRLVKTPGALLAVRGTQYTIDVDATGQTILDVFEGAVEVRSALRPQPFLVRAGQESIYGRARAPLVQPIPDERRRRGPGPHELWREGGERGRHDGEPRHGEPGSRPEGEGRRPSDGRPRDGDSGHHPPPGMMPPTPPRGTPQPTPTPPGRRP